MGPLCLLEASKQSLESSPHHCALKNVARPRISRKAQYFTSFDIKQKACYIVTVSETANTQNHQKVQKKLNTISSKITHLRLLFWQLIGVSDPTRPTTETTKGKTSLAVSRSKAAVQDYVRVTLLEYQFLKESMK
jgi:hypothetical protein